MAPKSSNLIAPNDLANQVYFQELTRRVNVLYDNYLIDKEIKKKWGNDEKKDLKGKISEKIEEIQEKILKEKSDIKKINLTREVIVLKANLAILGTMDGGEILKLSQCLSLLAKDCEDIEDEQENYNDDEYEGQKEG